MKVALIGTFPASMVNFRGKLLQDIAAQGHSVFAFANGYSDAQKQQIRDFGAEPVEYEIDRTGTHPLKDLKSALQLRGLIRHLGIQVILTNFMKPVVYASLAAVGTSAKDRYALLPGLGYAFTETGSKKTSKQRVLSFIIERLLKLSLKHNSKLFLYNRDDVDEISQRKLISPNRIVQLGGTGVDLADFTVTVPPTAPVTFILVARLLREKGIVEFAHAAAQVKNRFPDTEFQLLGMLDSNPGALAKSEVQGWVEEGILEWPGYVEDVTDWLQSASVFVLPSYYREGVPRSTQEAMAMGRPIITTDAPGCRETIVNEENGYMVPVRDSSALADAMVRFIESPEKIGRMGLRSREIAEQRFDVRRINSHIIREMGLESS